MKPKLCSRSAHGGADHRPFEGVDYSVNTNPYGPNPVLLEALQSAHHDQYPDPHYTNIRDQLAQYHGVAADEIALGVGASDLMYRCVRALLQGPLLSLGAPFGELARAVYLENQSIITTDADSIEDDLTWHKPSMIYISQPHNPTGALLPWNRLHELITICQRYNTIVLVDLAYLPFLTIQPIFKPQNNVCYLFSAGKAHGLVGARPAYALASSVIVEYLDNLAPAWHIPASTAAVLAAIPHATDFLEKTIPSIRQQAAELAEQISHQWPVIHSETPYMMIEVNHASAAAEWLYTRGIKVRDCTSYGFSRHIRVSSQLVQHNKLLVRQLDLLSRCLPEIARPSVTSSAYSSAPPTGKP